MSRDHSRGRMAGALVSALTGAAVAQCPDQWIPSGWSVGQVADVQAACVWDPDGSGPAPDLLVVGGDFHLAGGVRVGNLATWDGAAWGPLGQPLDGPVTGLATYGGVLFASSSWYGATSTIYRFDGTSWIADTHHAGQVLGVYAGKLITSAYPNSWTWWAWDGAAWSAVPPGNCGVSVGEYQGQLVSTQFMFYTPCVSRFDGSAWIDFSGGLTCVPQFGFTSAILGIGGDLYIAGDFCVQTSHGVGHWDGAAWQPMGTGAGVYAWLNHNGSLVAAGAIPVAGGTTRLALWNGQAWEALLAPWGSASSLTPRVSVLCEFRGDIVLGGRFTVLNDQALNSIARWDGAALQPLGTGLDLASGGTVRALHAEGPDLYVGGYFTTVGGLRSGSVAHFNGAAWDNMGGGLGYTDPQFAPAASVIARFGGELIVGGAFDLAGGAAARSIAAWDGSRWRSLGTGPGFSVRALAEYQGLLYAGGTSYSASGLARWNGSAWEGVPTPSSGNVDALVVYNGELCVGGPAINVPGGVGGLGRWDGSQWLPVGSPGQVVDARHLAVYNGELIIATSSDNLRSILRWSGQGLSPLGLGPPPWAEAFAVANGELLVAGRFSSAGTGPANNVAIWDGATWRALGLGVQAAPGQQQGAYAAAVYAGGVEVGGDFYLAGGEVSPVLARWGPGAPACAANCDCSSAAPVLNVLDFACFLNQFAAGDVRANCDGSAASPVLNVLDFVCFLNRFAAGCS